MSTGFPSAQPAMTFTINIGIPHLVGSASRGTPCTVVPITDGTLVSEPDFPVEIDAELVGTGTDYIHNDAGGRHMRLDAHAVASDGNGGMIYLKYYGIIEITAEMTAILGGSSDAVSTDFGHSFIHMQFETGSEKYRDLETGLFVGAGRFLVNREGESGIGIEYKICKIVGSH